MKVQLLHHTLDKGWDTDLPDVSSDHLAVLAFCSPQYRDGHEALTELKKKYPHAKTIGCSSSGEIFGKKVHDKSMSVALCEFDKTSVEYACTEVAGENPSENAGKALAEKLNKTDLKAVLVLSDGLAVNGTDLVRGINNILPEGTIVTGGLAGDGADFGKTFVLAADGQPQENLVTALGFYGNAIRVHHGSQGGWTPFGPERTITKSENNVLFELDDSPALEIYKDYLGDQAKELPGSALLFPLAILSDDDSNDDKMIVRTILSVDHENNSMTFAGDIPQGATVQLMKASFDHLVEGASEAAAKVANLQDDQETLAVSISCVGRRLLLQDRTNDELEATLHHLPQNTKQVGFYSYGELSPYVQGAPCDLHNQTMTITTFQED